MIGKKPGQETGIRRFFVLHSPTGSSFIKEYNKNRPPLKTLPLSMFVELWFSGNRTGERESRPLTDHRRTPPVVATRAPTTPPRRRLPSTRQSQQLQRRPKSNALSLAAPSVAVRPSSGYQARAEKTEEHLSRADDRRS